MGSGEIVGNQSVYWRMAHKDLTGKKKPLKCQIPGVGPKKPLPGPHTIHVSDEAFAHDDISFADIGKSHGKPGMFKVTLRFPGNGAATAELTRALQALGTTNSDAAIYVPAISRPSTNVDPANPPAEIELEW